MFCCAFFDEDFPLPLRPLHKSASKLWKERAQARKRLREASPPEEDQPQVIKKKLAKGVVDLSDLPASEASMVVARRLQDEAKTKEKLAAALWGIAQLEAGNPKVKKRNGLPAKLREKYEASILAGLRTYSISSLSNALRAWRTYVGFLAVYSDEEAALLLLGFCSQKLGPATSPNASPCRWVPHQPYSQVVAPRTPPPSSRGI